ncbi:hypothetical protein AK830_g214 [Neonectria ditissima]|uniref:lytic cellulose monooxygenase (C4-dehydrogenating) n=1 Tax=Neonectria ditissima TaxID=78410 RepID=A0A0P7BM05_9HYPO|nr:hypothetical protein AK830_g214 [Neonectria ditissima]
MQFYFNSSTVSSLRKASQKKVVKSTMTILKTSSILLGLATMSQVTAHGHVDWLITNGVAYRGYDAPAFSWNPNHDPVVGWTIGATDNGYSAKAAKGHVTVQAGDKINLQWSTWPESHKGPVIDYLAKCPGNCEDVDKTQLQFFKISASGLIDMSLQSGKWAADVLISKGFSWTIQIPASLAAGNYVLRHEIIALHGSGQPNGAQNYPQCFNIKVLGGGTLAPAGVKGTALYKSNDPGILFNLYTTPLSYTIPGPTLVSGLPSTVAQVATSASVTSSATTPGQDISIHLYDVSELWTYNSCNIDDINDIDERCICNNHGRDCLRTSDRGAAQIQPMWRSGIHRADGVLVGLDV